MSAKNRYHQLRDASLKLIENQRTLLDELEENMVHIHGWRPGQEPDPEPEPPAPEPDEEGLVFERPGEFFVVTKGEPHHRIDFDTPPGLAFKEVEVTFEFQHVGWNAEKPEGSHTIFWLQRGKDWIAGQVMGYLIAKGGRRRVVRLETWPEGGETATDAERVTMAGDYECVFSHGAGTGAKAILIGVTKQTEIAVPGFDTITDPGERPPYWIVFGNPAPEDGEPTNDVTWPPGTTFSNLRVEFKPV